ncbi:MAG: dihydrofolate reductase, partial [Gemmatimonadetes bacterium]|nr:dihydrofolate reductase [Gemmatimonadota bacterium]NIR77937.1 dihydrofolate reductase [Gemmatimonadota bacterium]NIT87157.1 dihydrofolate reductase [Gemmatimonadota bacterium]NIU30324.1 dihydrofolate reductase [Gemmatimonadota bacterium]NIU35215.1 dihydrofolate reductase [Gemmatimonadota bacterium]
AEVERLRASEGKDIWLFGGGRLFRSLVDAGLVDTVEVAIVPVLLGDGVPLLPAGPGPVRLELSAEETFPSGIVLARYTVNR